MAEFADDIIKLGGLTVLILACCPKVAVFISRNQPVDGRQHKVIECALYFVLYIS